MFISHMLVENYRTFCHVELHFDSRMWVNYIVGDNNIGKSNFLTLWKTLPTDTASGRMIFWIRISLSGYGSPCPPRMTD